jgi:hypothetical protein
MKKLLLLLAISAVAALCVTATALADNPRLTFSPDPIAVGDSLVFSGCGYTPNVAIQVQAVHNTKPYTWILQIGETTDANGCFSTADFLYTVPVSGKVTASVFEGLHKDVTINFTVG